MKAIYVAGTLVFAAAIAALVLSSLLSPPDRAREPLRSFTLEEIARHAVAADCWMAIRGTAYDLTEYVPRHPTATRIISEWCGKEATLAFETKNRGRPHSSHAWEMLETYAIGPLQETDTGDSASSAGESSQ